MDCEVMYQDEWWAVRQSDAEILQILEGATSEWILLTAADGCRVWLRVDEIRAVRELRANDLEPIEEDMRSALRSLGISLSCEGRRRASLCRRRGECS